MTYGITGNPRSEKLWQPAADLAAWLEESGIPFALERLVAEGLASRALLPQDVCRQRAADDLATGIDVVLSFGGDGTLLNTAQRIGTAETPILGVNIGRLGFLTGVEAGSVTEAIELIEEGSHDLDARMVLAAEVRDHLAERPRWALNDVVVAKAASASMIEISTHIDGVFLNDYWADGLIVATPTGSTAYSLAAGGPLLAPQSGVIALTPIAPHTLTTRPIVVPQSVEITLRVTAGAPFLVACDGRTEVVEDQRAIITVRRAGHRVHLVRLPETDYFQTVRRKLNWGVR